MNLLKTVINKLKHFVPVKRSGFSNPVSFSWKFSLIIARKNYTLNSTLDFWEKKAAFSIFMNNFIQLTIGKVEQNQQYWKIKKQLTIWLCSQNIQWKIIW